MRTDNRRRKRREEKRKRLPRLLRLKVASLLFDEQGGRCFVCDEQHPLKTAVTDGLVLDHCHETGGTRALLCTRCNAALGLMRESPRLLTILALYARHVCGRI